MMSKKLSFYHGRFEGHPDKVSDRISDMVVDTYISADPYSRVALMKH